MRRIPWVLSIGAVTVAAMPAARAGDTPPNAPTVGIEWELKGPAERRYSASDANWGDHFFVLGGWNKTTSARVDVDSASFERVMCTKKMFGTYPLVSITVDNVGADSSNPTSDQVTAGWRRGTVEIVTGPIAYNDLKRWTQVFTFLSGFFSAVKVACQNNPVGTGTDCVAPIGDVVAAMNQLQTIRADDDLTAINNKTAFACGGPESALREPTSTQRQAGITPESLRDQKIARIRDAAGDAAVITRSTFALTAVHPVTKAPTGILGGVGTQVSFSIGLHQIAAGELSELFAPERGAKGAAQLAYEAALAASSPTLAAWVKTKNLNGLSPAPATTPDEVGF